LRAARLQAGSRRHCFKETGRALSLRPVENMDEGQKSEGISSHTGD
jgi:hypothetical protein